MKVLWVGDAAVSTGFARCTHAACDALHAAGHEVRVLGINYYGDPHPHPYPIHPCHQPFDGGRDGFGVTRLRSLVHRYPPDLIVLLNDPWNVPAYIKALHAELPDPSSIPPVVAWCAVDAVHQDASGLNSLAHLIVWTEFAANELVNGGYYGVPSIIPLGVDSITFSPGPKDEARRRALAPELHDSYIIGVVGRNQERKRLDLTIEAFRLLLDSPTFSRADDAILYLHVAPTGENAVDIRALTRHYNLGGRVAWAQPHIGMGAEESHLVDLYRSMDVYLTTSQGEGWGLPALEAMACGVPVVAPNWSGLGCWARDVATFIPVTMSITSAPVGGEGKSTLGGLVHPADAAEVLERVANDPAGCGVSGLIRNGLALANSLSWDRVGREMLTTLTHVYEIECLSSSQDAAE